MLEGIANGSNKITLTVPAAIAVDHIYTFSETGLLLDGVDVSGVSSLATLTDVSIVTPATNDFLQYNGTAWVKDSATYTTVTGHTTQLSAAGARFANMSTQLTNLKVAMLTAGFPSIPTRVTPATANHTSTTNSFLLNYTSPVGTSLAYVYNGGSSTAMTTGVNSAALTAPAANTPYGYTVTATKTSTGYTATDSGTFTYTTPVLALSPSTKAFATTDPLATSAPQAFTVTNTGLAVGTLGTFALSGTNANQFILSSNTCGGTLAASGSCGFNVAFAPTTSGAKTASIGDGTLSSSLSGTGTAAVALQDYKTLVADGGTYVVGGGAAPGLNAGMVNMGSKFTSTASATYSMTSVKLKLKNIGIPTGAIGVKIFAHSVGTGMPSTLIATSATTFIAANLASYIDSNTPAAEWKEFIISGVTIVPGSTYWIIPFNNTVNGAAYFSVAGLTETSSGVVKSADATTWYNDAFNSRIAFQAYGL
jgi:hypothetical protein